MAANQAEVDLVVNAAGALPDLERQLTQIIDAVEAGADDIDVQASIGVQQAIDTMSTQLDRAIAGVDGQSPTIDVDAALDLQETLRNLRQDVEDVTRSVNAGADPLELTAALDFPESLQDITRDLNLLIRDAELSAEVIRLDAELDERANERLNERLERIRQRIRRLGSELRGFGASSGRALGTFGAGLSGLIVAGGSLVNTLAAVAAAVQQIAPAAAVGTSALLTVKLAAGTVQLAMIGVEEAIENAFDPDVKPEELQKSLERLAPEARSFVLELRNMRGELVKVQQGVQNRVFRGLDDVLKDLGTSVGPVLTQSLNRSADSLNAMARGAAEAASQMAEQGVFGQALEGANDALETLEKVPARVVRSFSFLAAASAPALNRIAGAVDDVSLRIQQKLQRAFESGALERAIDQAVSTLAQLGRVVQNFGGGVANIFTGLTQNGRGLFQILEDISEAFNRLTASREFQSILSELAATADTLVQNVLPLIQEAFVQLGPVIETLAPVIRDFITAIGPELIPIIQQLGPILVDIALILQDQLPLAIELTKAALDVLGVALTVLKGVFDVAREGSQAFADFMESDFARAMGASSDAVTENSDEIISAISNWVAEGIQLVSDFNSALSDFSSGLRDLLVGGFTTAFNDVISNVQTFVQLVQESFSGLPDRLFEVGVNIMAGLANGLTAGIGRVLSIARGIADSISDTIDQALDIHSPSRVMKRKGENVVQGLVDGMLAKRKLLTDTAEALAKITATAFNPVRGFSGVAQNAIPTFTGKGTNVVNVFIGNQLVKQIINDQFKAAMNQRDRAFAQGVRI
ncbi:hypothetical protein AB0F16_38180 [Streptomyces tanashiensis]|uniref:phage tail protein n=1 Tax=Streptomyces tanashiensis TaxID=67367 RepID=UPI0033EFEB0E